MSGSIGKDFLRVVILFVKDLLQSEKPLQKVSSGRRNEIKISNEKGSKP